jgi:hypothetical protein
MMMSLFASSHKEIRVTNTLLLIPYLVHSINKTDRMIFLMVITLHSMLLFFTFQYRHIFMNWNLFDTPEIWVTQKCY